MLQIYKITKPVEKCTQFFKNNIFMFFYILLDQLSINYLHQGLDPLLPSLF